MTGLAEAMLRDVPRELSTRGIYLKLPGGTSQDRALLDILKNSGLIDKILRTERKKKSTRCLRSSSG
jgi:hypothetical protein